MGYPGDKMIFLERVPSPEMDEQVRLKGTLVQVSKSPKEVMLVLFPNVKNLAELEDVNISWRIYCCTVASEKHSFSGNTANQS
jgi:hypothetical protein